MGNNELYGAIFEQGEKYRYVLWRLWSKSKPYVLFIGLNPSSANNKDNDPTVRRLISLCRSNEFGGFSLCNLFGIITPNPRVIHNTPDPILNQDGYIQAHHNKSDITIFMWGSFKEARERAAVIIDLYGEGAMCFKQNADGSPIHPLYLPSGSQLIKFNKKLIK